MAVALLLTAVHPAAAFVLGGGLANKDCRVAFGGVDATDGASQVTCTDGAACDADGTVNGTCLFEVALCTGVAVPGCAPGDVTSVEVRGSTLAPPSSPAAPGACGPAETLGVQAGSASNVAAVARDGRSINDVDLLVLCCRSEPAPFDAALCAITSQPALACLIALGSERYDVFDKAREFVRAAVADPARARVHAKQAVKQLKKLKRTAKRLARTDKACGYVLGLVASHAIETVRAAVAPQ